jgi:hypothetical protein
VYDAQYEFIFIQYHLDRSDASDTSKIVCSMQQECSDSAHNFMYDILYTKIISELRHQIRAEMHACRSSCRVVVKNVRGTRKLKWLHSFS